MLIERKTQFLVYNKKEIEDIYKLYNKNQLTLKKTDRNRSDSFIKKSFIDLFKSKPGFGKSGSKRRYINDHRLLKDYLQKKYNNKFKNIILEKYSFDKQVTLFQNAKIIIGQHGAGLVNLIFCKPNTVVFEIGPRNMIGFMNIASNKKLKYYYSNNNYNSIIRDFEKYI